MSGWNNEEAPTRDQRLGDRRPEDEQGFFDSWVTCDERNAHYGGDLALSDCHRIEHFISPFGPQASISGVSFRPSNLTTSLWLFASEEATGASN